MQKARILAVDDQAMNLRLLQEILQGEYTILAAKSGAEALRLARNSPDLILLDVMMPDMNGYTVCRKLKADETTRKIPVIFVTALNEEQDETKGFEAGGVDYITKPVKPLIVKARVKTHLELRTAEMALSRQKTDLEKKVVERTRALFDSRMEVVHRLVFAAEYKDPETGSHIKRMSHYSERLAAAYGLNEKEREVILLASPMHDIGKIGIPDHILLKPGKLNSEEWTIMKTHTNIGAKILSKSRSSFLRAGQQIAISHHEKWDGTGYPQRLKGEAIPVFGRISALADFFDALTSRRPYKEAWSVESAFAEIRKLRGTQFEPRLVDAFFSVTDELLTIKKRFPAP